MNFHIITIFPKIFDSYFSESIIKRAQEGGIINIKTYDLRDWTSDKHKSVDDTPYGGGAGMLLKVEPIYKAIQDVKSKILKNSNSKNIKVVLTSAKGKKWDQQKANSYSKINDLIIICGRYEGVDERVLSFIDEEISIGDYVMTGGEIPAMAMIDSITRLIPGTLGNEDSSVSESHSKTGSLEYPQYTRPEIFTADGKNHKVPDILLSGDHQKIEEWKEDMKHKI